MSINSLYFWTESGYLAFQITIRTSSLDALKKLRRSNIWKYWPGKLNPMDMASQGLVVSNRNLEKVDHWLIRPSFLLTKEQSPTDIDLKNITINETDLELHPDFMKKQADKNSVLVHTSSCKYSSISHS